MNPIEPIILQNAEGGVIAADEAGCIQFANATAAEVMGRPLPHRTPLTDLMPERLRGRHRAGFSRYVRTGNSRLEGKTIRVPALDAEGREHGVDLTIRVFQRPDGTRLAVASVQRAEDTSSTSDLHRIETALSARAYNLI